MIAPSEAIRKAMLGMSPGFGMLRIHTIGGDTIRIVRRRGGWYANFRDDVLRGGLVFVTDGPMLDIIMSDIDTSVSSKLSMLSASVSGISFWDGSQAVVLWGASA